MRWVPKAAGPRAAIDITEEFAHRPWHQNVRCPWDGEILRLEADNDYDENGLALSDEFSDAILLRHHHDQPEISGLPPLYGSFLEFRWVGSTCIASRAKIAMSTPMSSEQMQAAIKELQETMVVMAHIEKTQTEHIRELVQFRIQSEKFRLRTEENLAEITDKLNGLIGYVAGGGSKK